LVKISSIEKKDEYKEKLFSKLSEFRSMCTIVEGKRDKIVLKKINFEKLFVLNDYGGLFDIAEKLKNKRVLILTDFDPEGEKIAIKLSSLLIKMNSNIRKNERDILRNLFFLNKLSTIEGLGNLLDKE